MAHRAREKAVCLFVADFSETSQVAHFLARDSGVVHLLAKGSKRPKSPTGGRIDLLAEGQLVFIPPRAETMGTLVEFTELTNHSALRRRLTDLNAALYMLEITRMLLAEGDPHPPVFDLLSAALGRLDRDDAPTQAVLAYFQWRLLRHAGLLGEMDRCVDCGQAVGRQGNYFTSQAGGMLCQQCQSGRTEKRRVGLHALAGVEALRAMDRKQNAQLLPQQSIAVNRLLAYHLSYQLGKTPKMLRHISGGD